MHTGAFYDIVRFIMRGVFIFGAAIALSLVSRSAVAMEGAIEVDGVSRPSPVVESSEDERASPTSLDAANVSEKHNFVWVDLSTYDVRVARRFYSALFGWSYDTGVGGYFNARRGNRVVSGLYQTPKELRDVVPAFWMSYILVNDVEKTVAEARRVGGTIEFTDTSPAGRVALIRDPLGAGFTVYQGSAPSARTTDQVGTFIWNELYVSDAAKVIPFYQKVFGWQITQSAPNTYAVSNNGQRIATIHHGKEELRFDGQYQYWVVSFAVSDLDSSTAHALNGDYTVVSEEPGRTLFVGQYGDLFYLTEVKK